MIDPQALRQASAHFRGRVLRLGLVQSVGELAQVGAEDSQEARHGDLAHVATAALDLGDVGVADPGACAHLLLREPRLLAQLAQGSAKDAQILSGGVCGVRGHQLERSACQNFTSA